MADETWQKVRGILDSALRRQPEERQSFVHEACGKDKTLLAEVESLLSSLDSASLLETPVIAQVVDEAVGSWTSRFLTGTLIGLLVDARGEGPKRRKPSLINLVSQGGFALLES